MNRFIGLTVGFSLLFVFIHLLSIELFVRKIMIPQDPVIMKQNALVEQMESIEVIGIGDSHTECALICTNKVLFNYGRGGDPAPLMYFKTKFALTHAKNIHTVLLQLDYHQFSDFRTNVDPGVIHFVSIIDEDVKELFGYPRLSKKNSIILYSLKKNYAPIVHKSIYQYLRGSLRPIEAHTAKWSDVSELKRNEFAKKVVDIQINSPNIMNTTLLFWYEKTIRFIQSSHVQVVLVRYPLSSEYLDAMDTDAEQEFNQLVSRLQNSYNCCVLDYHRLFYYRRDLFFNQDHVNFTGGTFISHTILNDIDTLTNK